jgi:predicted dehydrogenase
MAIEQNFNVKPLRVALVGYGNAGRIFHAPLISGVPGLALHTVVSSKPQAVLADWPAVRVVPVVDQSLADPAVDIVVVASSNATHHPIARAALLAGKHVVVDKPCTVTLAETQDLLELAKVQGRVLTVFQNRRWDADFLALQQVIASGQLGRIVHFESHFDRYRPLVLDRWRDHGIPGSGLWVDLGAHLVDQALQLFGVPDDLLLGTAQQRDHAQTNDWFHAQLRYDSTHPGLRVVLHGSTLVPALGPRFIVHGTKGSFVKYGLDTQEDALKAGGRPVLGASGMTQPAQWGADPFRGELVLAQGDALVRQPAPDAKGDYLAYYVALRDHLSDTLGGSPDAAALPVTPDEVLQVMTLLSRGEQSVAEGRFVSTADLLGIPDA